MADDEQRERGGNGARRAEGSEGTAEGEAVGGLAPRAEQSDQEQPPAPADRVEAEEEERPRITLDRYMSGRRRTRTGWAQLIALSFMLLTLILLLVYKDRCGNAVSGFLFMGNPDAGRTVRIKLDPASKGGPVSRPASSHPASSPSP
jgi:hypothetical protein